MKLAFVFFTLVLALDLEIETDANIVMQKGAVVNQWNPDFASGSGCHPVLQVTEGILVGRRDFTFKNKGNSPIMIEGLSSFSEKINVLTPILYSSDFSIGPKQSKDVTLDYECTGVPGWGIVHISFVADGEEYEIKWTKICDLSEVSSMDWSMPILLIIALLVVGFSA